MTPLHRVHLVVILLEYLCLLNVILLQSPADLYCLYILSLKAVESSFISWLYFNEDLQMQKSNIGKLSNKINN